MNIKYGYHSAVWGLCHSALIQSWKLYPAGCIMKGPVECIG